MVFWKVYAMMHGQENIRRIRSLHQDDIAERNGQTPSGRTQISNFRAVVLIIRPLTAKRWGYRLGYRRNRLLFLWGLLPLRTSQQSPTSTRLKLIWRLSPGVERVWNLMAHGNAPGRKWSENWRMEWVASTLHTTSEHDVSSINTADAHTSAASSRLNWRPSRFKWTRPFRRKTKSGSCACAITFQTQSTDSNHGANQFPPSQCLKL